MPVVQTLCEPVWAGCALLHMFDGMHAVEDVEVRSAVAEYYVLQGSWAPGADQDKNKGWC